MDSSWGWKIRNKITASEAAVPNNIKPRCLWPLDSERLFQLYILRTVRKIIKEQIEKSFGQIINSVYPFLAECKQNFMKGGKPLVIIGTIILIFGLIFHLQGQSVIGPESSFMYSNPDWITYGIQIAIVGIIIVVVGIASIIKRN